MGNEGRVIIFVLISRGKSCGPAGSLEKKRLEGGSFCMHPKWGLRNGAGQELLNKPGFFSLKGEKRENQKSRKASLNAEYPSSSCSTHRNID